MEDQVPEFSTCPRCGAGCFEYLESHAHCVACFYSPQIEAEYEQIPEGALRALVQSLTLQSPEDLLIQAEEAALGVA